MKLSRALTLLALGSTALCDSLTAKDVCLAQNATVSAMIYGYPLLAYAQAWDKNTFSANLTTNSISAASGLIRPNDTAVVLPNADVLLAEVFYDVSSDDVVLTVPTIENRYWDVAFYTPYGDNYLNVGAVGSDKAGKYLITSDRPGVHETSYSTNSTDPEYQQRIVAETTMGILVIRLLVKNDLDVVKKYQAGFAVNVMPRNQTSTGPTFNSSMLANVSSSPAENLMALTARFAPALTDQSILPEFLNSTFSSAGISNSTYTAPPCVNASAALLTAQAAIEASPNQKYTVYSLGNHWTAENNSKIGLYNNDYTARAYIAEKGYLAMVDTQAIYPNLQLSNLTLLPNESYIFSFSAKPALQSLGFWSLTVYNAAGFVVANSIDRYTLGDRSNLTYANGTLVYSTDTDGPFEILLQSEQPPANWTSNWLPAPATGDVFQVLFRLYVPLPAMTNGSYVYPVVTKGKAITGSSNSTTSTSTGSGSSSAATSTSGSGSSSGSSTSGSPSSTTSFAIASSTGGAVAAFSMGLGTWFMAGMMALFSTIVLI